MEIWLLVFNSELKLILSYFSIWDACMILFWSPKLRWAWIVLWQCSASCGKGDRARYVSCRDAHGGIADESLCAHLPRPAEISSCFSPCGEWQVGNWSPVSIDCNFFFKYVYLDYWPKSLVRNWDFMICTSVIEIAFLEKTKYIFLTVKSKYKHLWLLIINVLSQTLG